MSRGGEEGPRFRRALTGGVVLAAAIAYASTAPRWILGGDNGEFATLFATGGIAHPPGYPAMVLWLRLFRWLPTDTPAHGAALATVVLGAMAVWTLQRACLAWGASTGATAFASAVFAFSPLAWKMGCHAEAFAMNAMFAGAILALSAPLPRLHGWRQTLALGLTAGVALANHQTILLLAPVGLIAAARAVREAPRPWRAALVGVLALVGGLVPPYVYDYVLARSGDFRVTPLWIEAPTLAGLFFHFRRGAYGTLSLAGALGPRIGVAEVTRFAWASARDLLGMPVVVVAAATMSLATRRAWPRRARASIVALVVAFLLAGPLFVAWFDVPLEHEGATVVERFYLLPEVMLALVSALSIDALVPWLVTRRGVMSALTVQAGVAAAALSLPEVREYDRPTVAMYVDNTLQMAPKGAVLVGTGDPRWGGFLYARYALHQRLDVVYLSPALLPQAWYRREMAELTGVSLETPEHRPVGPKTLMARLLQSGRPLLYTDWPDATVAGTRHATVGTLMRILGEGEDAPTPGALLAANVEAFEGYAIEPDPPSDPHAWGHALHADYARPWTELAALYLERGDIPSQQACLARASQLAPWLLSRVPRTGPDIQSP
jgi:hypothetical protein